MYMLQSESTLYSCLKVKELLAQNRCNIWSLSDCSRTRTHNHWVHKQTLNHLAKLAKWLSCVLSTYLYGALTVYSYYIMYKSQSESTLYSCLNANKLLAQNRRDIWSWSGLSCSGFESHCSHLNFRYHTCFKQGVPWHSGNYEVYIHSKNKCVTW